MAMLNVKKNRYRKYVKVFMGVITYGIGLKRGAKHATECSILLIRYRLKTRQVND